MNTAGAKRLTGWRRVAHAMWRPPDDPQIFGALDIDARAMLAKIAHARETGIRLTPTHFVGRALAHALVTVPDLNVQIRGGRVRQRESVDIFFITAVSGGHDLSGVKVVDAGHKSVAEIATELAARSAKLRAGNDPEFKRTKQLTDRAPAWILRPLLRLSAYLSEDLGLDLPLLGLHPSPFGSAMVTSVGSFGLPQGFAPLAWMYDVPILVLVGELAERAVVEDGRVVPRTMLPITATIDHRYVDGWHVSHAMRAFREFLEAP